MSSSSAIGRIRLANLTAGYERHPAVHHVDGSFERGTLTAIVGPNGAGKSTLLKTIAGLLAPLSGHVDLGGLRRRDIAYLPQQAEIDRSFPISVADTVLLGGWARTGIFGGASKDLRRRAAEALEAVGLGGFEARPIGSLSAGQFQRVLFARLLLQDGRVIMLDEPFTALDAKTTRDLVDVVRRWHGEGRTVITVLHDLDQVREVCPDTLLLARDPIGWGPTGDVLCAENLLRARTMAEAWADRGEACRRSAA
ncbi:metal ABC transporter ATP-binding protein [Inquilinus sp. NPDC058860]|uniref:metal ABC transporter ATP-binding protein n=1 Tax=Inquilinus sp. NPDC058860 TaxID=3346652 RepID=UPI00369D99D7